MHTLNEVVCRVHYR